MKLSIRIRLTLLIATVFFSVLVFLLLGGIFALYVGLIDELDRTLKIEEKVVVEMLGADFSELLFATETASINPDEDLTADLNEMVMYKRQFIVVSLESHENRRIYNTYRQKNILLQLPEDFLAQEGFFNHNVNGIRYRVLVSKPAWGTLAIGLENRTFFEVLNEFRKILIFGMPIILVLILGGSWFLARFVMRPVVSAAQTAGQITLTNLEQRLPEYGGQDEFGVLVSTLNRMIARIEEGVKRIRQFTQDAAHELRTPLTIQRGELELLYEQEKLPGESRAAVQKTLDRAISMSKIVDNLMLLAQSDTGRYPIQKQKFRFDQVLKETVEDAQNLTEDRSLKIRLSGCEPLEFFGDEQLIRRLLLNLSDNALRYTTEGQIEFGLKSLQNDIEITIGDTGRGIPKEDLPHIFDRFYRVDKPRNSANSGSGLGLAISKWIVSAHKGEISIDSEWGKGTRIKIRLPNSASTD